MQELEEHQQLVVQDEIGLVPLNRMRDKLLSKSFLEALWFIVNSSADRTPLLESLTLEHLQSSLHCISKKLQFVQHIHTRFLLLPRLLDITRRGNFFIIPEWEGAATRHRTTHFVDKSRARILAAEPPSYMSIYDILAAIVSQVLGSPTVLPIGPLFSCPPGSEKAIVRVLRMGSEGNAAKSESRNGISIGEELLPQDALQVQFHPLRPFYAGEIVAWRLGKDGEKLKYGKVPENVRPSAGQALYRFSVETASGKTQTLLSSQVFSFRSVSMADASSSSQKTEESSSEQVPTGAVSQAASPEQVRLLKTDFLKMLFD